MSRLAQQLKSKVIVLAVVVLFFSLSSYGSNLMTIEGTIMQFDDKTIHLKQSHGAIVLVPRSAKKEMKGVKLGRDTMSVQVPPGEFMKLNASFFPEKQKALEVEKKLKQQERAKK